MFERNKKLKSISPTADSLFEIYSSINTPLVAVEENPAEQCRGFIIVLSPGRKEYDFYVFLHLLSSNKGVFYVAEKIKESDYPDAKNEAFNFVESMGFLMERVYSIEEGREKAEECLRTFPMFYNNLQGKEEKEEVIKLEDEAVIEIKEQKKEETGTIDEVEILLDEVEKQEQERKKISEKKGPVVGKIQVKSVVIQNGEKERPGVSNLKKLDTFFRFLASC